MSRSMLFYSSLYWGLIASLSLPSDDELELEFELLTLSLVFNLLGIILLLFFLRILLFLVEFPILIWEMGELTSNERLLDFELAS